MLTNFDTELLKIVKCISLLENYEVTPEERADPVRNSISYPAFEQKAVTEMFDETGVTTPYGEDSGVITPKFVKENPNKMNKNMNTVNEKGPSQDDLYSALLSQALEKATQYAESKGYSIDSDEIFSAFGTGGISYGETKRGYLTLYKNGSPINKKLAVQIYRMPSGKYELNKYINEKHLETSDQHNQFDSQMKLEQFFGFLNDKDKEIQLFKKILYENGLYLKLIKMKSGKTLSNSSEILNDVRDILLKLEMPLKENIKKQMLQIIDSLMPAEAMSEKTCACDEMNEKKYRIKSIKIIK